MAEPRAFDGNYHGEPTGCLPRQTALGDERLPLLGDEYLVPEDEWDDRCREVRPIALARAKRTPWIYQGNQGSCCPSGGGHFDMWLDDEERETVTLVSQATLYAWRYDYQRDKIIPRTSDSGTYIDELIILWQRIGYAPASVIDPLDWRRRDWPADWEKHAAPHKLIEVQDCSHGMKYVMSRLSQGKGILHGYASHARFVVAYNPETKLFECKNSHRSAPWHYLSWRQMETGLRDYGGLAGTVTVAR